MTLTAAVAWLMLYGLARRLKLNEKGFEVKPLLLIYRTTRFNRILDYLSMKCRELWSLYSTISIFVGFGMILFSLYMLAGNLVKLMARLEGAVGLVPIIPGITVGFEPLLYLLPSILVGLTAHELLHGIVARLERIPVKSSGIVVVFMVFGGFVEPDEEAFKKSKAFTKLRVLSSGPSANLALAVLGMILLNVLFHAPQGLLVHSVSEDSPFYGLGLKPWSVVTEINGVEVGRTKPSIPLITPYRNPLPEFRKINLTGRILVKTDEGVLNLTLMGPEPQGLGVRFYVYPYSPSILGDLLPKPLTFTAYLMLIYVSSINVALAVFNMLPMYPLDGYGFLDVFLEKLKNTRLRKAASICLNGLSISLLVLNVLFTILGFRILV